MGNLNRLRLQRIYLVGPMDYDRDAGKPWREDLTIWLKARKALPIDPYCKPIIYDIAAKEDDDMAERREAAMQMGDFDAVSKIVKKIRVTDLRITDMSDVVVANLDIEKVPCGTYEEIFTCNRSKKPILVHCPQGVKEIPRWMFGVLPYQFFFDSWTDVKEYLRHIDEDEVINTLGRWRFFDFEPLIREVLELPGREE